jgi:pyruvate ferredoxin oxidoreductase delta subunit
MTDNHLEPGGNFVAPQSAKPKWTELAVGTAITEPGSSRAYRTGDWRSARPIWNDDHCVQCGVCVIFCPEGCIAFADSGYPTADLDYCKGCGICMVECPVQCIHMEQEEA